MTGTSGPDDRILRTTSNPSPSGIITSSRTRSGLDAVATRSASAPLVAVITSNPANRSDPDSSSRIVSSSSTTSSRASPEPSPVVDLIRITAWRPRPSGRGGNAASPPRKCRRCSIVCSHVPAGEPRTSTACLLDRTWVAGIPAFRRGGCQDFTMRCQPCRSLEDRLMRPEAMRVGCLAATSP